MISSELRTIYEAQSGEWPPDAKAFSLTLLSVIEDLEARVKHLEDRLAVNSGNSSLPSSKDSLQSPKKRSLRVKSRVLNLLGRVRDGLRSGLRVFSQPMQHAVSVITGVLEVPLSDVALMYGAQAPTHKIRIDR